MGSKVLIVDDEREIADVVELYLKNENYQVVKCYNGRDALEAVEKEKPDLALLDVMLPDIDGFTILQKIREKYTFPVIMLTAKTEYMDKINGLTLIWAACSTFKCGSSSPGRYRSMISCRTVSTRALRF